MDIRIQPSSLTGTVNIPSSKSYAHRALICAALSDGVSIISGIDFSKDIEATISAMTALGAEITYGKMGTVTVKGISQISENATIDCNESGSTLRFLIPIVAALGINGRFCGKGRLPHRPIDIYVRELGKNGVNFIYNNTMPFDIKGKLQSGIYEVEGNVSSQFITGLLFSLPLLNGDSVIKMKSKLESKPYVDITIECLNKFGIIINEIDNEYHIKGGQSYKAFDMTIEGDYSQAAFFYVANVLGSNVVINNLNSNSVQGDKKILDIIAGMCYNNIINKFEVDCSDIPDLVPILTVLGCFGSEASKIFNASRLRIKESDRIKAIADALNRLGGNVIVSNDELIIEPIKLFHGGIVDSCGDHRIVMSAAVAALKADGDVIIKGADAVGKSYPNFFRDYNNLGGKANVIILE